MKRLKLLFVAVLLVCFSCDKTDYINDIDVEVILDKTEYNLGDTVVFSFEGEADIISFYSGEIGSDYAYKDGRISMTDFLVNFETQRQDGDLRQGKQLKLFISDRFDGILTFSNVHNFDGWVDISDHFTWAEVNNSAYVQSGTGNIRKYIDKDKASTIVFAIRHTIKNQLADQYGIGSLNRLRNFTFKSANLVNQEELFKHTTTTDWTLLSSPDKQTGRAAIEANIVLLRNSWNTNLLPLEQYDWAVSKPITVSPSVDMGPDRPIPIKSTANKMLKKYEHVYREAGTYEVVFVLKNQNIYGASEKIIKKTIIIND